MARQLDLADVTYHLTTSRFDGHKLTAYRNGKPIAYLRWSINGGHVIFVYVHKRYRRRGIASQLWRRAHKLANLGVVSRPKHAGCRTDAGDAWARAVGGHLPRRTVVEATDEAKRL